MAEKVQQTAVEIRENLTNVSKAALTEIVKELQTVQNNPKKVLSKAWCEKYKIIADQLRRDYRLNEIQDTPPTSESTLDDSAAGDPLGQLSLHDPSQKTA